MGLNVRKTKIECERELKSIEVEIADIETKLNFLAERLSRATTEKFRLETKLNNLNIRLAKLRNFK